MWLDVKTMMLTNAALLLIGAVASYASWHRHKAIDGLLWWSRGSGAIALGILVAAWIGPAPTPPLGPIAAFLMVAGMVMSWESMRRFSGKSTEVRTLALCVLAFIAVLAGSAALGVPFARRAALLTMTLSVFAGLAAWEALRGDRPEPLRSRFIIGTGFAVAAVLLSARGGLALLDLPVSPMTGFYDPSKGVTPFVAAVCIVCLNVGIMAMASEWLSRGVRRLALTDDLTGLPNRRSLVEQAGRLARRAGPQVPAAILMMDLDHFAEVNKLHGHAGGDKALVTFAKLLQENLRPTDVMARYGGEEFCAFLPRTGLAEARRIADRLRTDLARRMIHINGASFRVTVSIGIAAFPGGDLQASFRRADEALYRAKAGGRDQVVVGTSDLPRRHHSPGGTTAFACGHRALSI